MERAGAKPLEPMLAGIASLKSINDISAYLSEQHKTGMDRGVLFGFGSDQDYDNSSQMIATVLAGGLGLPDRDYYTKVDPKSQEVRQRYVQHVQRMLEMIGESAADARADAQSVMRIETALAQASLTRVEKRNPYNLKHKYSRDDLMYMVPLFDWDVYLSRIGVPEFQTVNVTEPKFLAEVNTELKRENLAAWRAYLRWHLVDAEANYLSSNFVQENFDFFGKYLQGLKELPPRWKKCTRLVNRQLGEALGQVFVSKTFSPQTKQDTLRVTQQVEEAMRLDIEDLTWMSNATRQTSLQKLRAGVNKIGYPDKWRDYSSVRIAPDDFLGNVTGASEFETHRQLTKIGRPVDRTGAGHDAAHRKCLLQFANERHKLPSQFFNPLYSTQRWMQRPITEIQERRSGMNSRMVSMTKDEVRPPRQSEGLVDGCGCQSVRESSRMRQKSIRAIHRCRRHTCQQQPYAR